jgi:hypothetical protein
MRTAPILVALLAAACARSPRGAPPSAEFLLVAGDSTYWVTSGPAGLRVRASGIMLARYDGRFHEVFIADDDHSYEDALLVGAQVYSRDLLSGDSTLAFGDTLVERIAREYAKAHPDETPLPPDDPGPDHPATAASSDVTFMDVHGPYLSVEYRARTRRRGGPSVHTAWRAVLDLRREGTQSLSDVVGGDAAAKAIAQGRRLFTHAIDSARTAARAISSMAAVALQEARFDERSFSIADSDGTPAIEFAGRVTGGAASGALLSLPRIPVPAPGWWGEVRSTLAQQTADDGPRWKHAGFELVTTIDSTGEQAQVALVDSAHHTWAVRQVPTPVQHVFWLDLPRADSATRASLRRAFDEAALYDGSGSIAQAAPPHSRSRFVPASVPLHPQVSRAAILMRRRHPPL